MLFPLVLVFTCIGSALLDCGCNKLDRQTTLSSAENCDVNDDGADNKVCEQQARTNNKHYRDYYPTEEIPVDMSIIPGGEYLIGAHKDEPHFEADGEGPERLVKVQDIYMDKYEVSNKKFSEFIEATKYKTEAEGFGDSFLFKTLLSPEEQEEYKDYRVVNALWWYKVKQVSWQHPNGPASNLEELWDHPVVHVSWNDASAYCKWRGKRLPTEAEWEVACRGGKKRKLFPWGNKLMPKDKHWLNIWQGEFPDSNTLEDGYSTTCPVTKFRQNEFDLYNIAGNVWEWVQDMWQPGDVNTNPSRVKKGGSYLCHESYCYRYRCAARSQNTEDSSAGNLGFRCAKDF